MCSNFNLVAFFIQAYLNNIVISKRIPRKKTNPSIENLIFTLILLLVHTPVTTFLMFVYRCTALNEKN